MAEGMNWVARLVPVMVALLQADDSLLGKHGEIDRLLVSLQVESEHTQAQLGWTGLFQWKTACGRWRGSLPGCRIFRVNDSLN